MSLNEKKLFYQTEQLTTYSILPPSNRTHLTVKLPACVPPPIEPDDGLHALLLSGHTTEGGQRIKCFILNFKQGTGIILGKLWSGCVITYVSN